MENRPKNEFDKYLALHNTLDENGKRITIHKYFLEKYKEYSTEYNTIPVCVMSYKFDKKNSKFLIHLLKHKMTIDRPYYIFTNERFVDGYKDLKNYSNLITIIDVPDYIDGLVEKRNYIMDFAKVAEFGDFFMIEDDIHTFSLPLEIEGNNITKKFRGIDYGLMFNVWESVIKNNALTFTGIRTEMAMAYGKGDMWDNETSRTANFVHAFHHNTKHNERYNSILNCGWDDYDMILQKCFKENEKDLPHVVNLISHYAPTFILENKKDLRTTNTLENYDEELEAKSFIFKEKWKNLARYETKKGVKNARINNRAIKKCFNEGFDLKHFMETGEYIKR